MTQVNHNFRPKVSTMIHDAMSGMYNFKIAAQKAIAKQSQTPSTTYTLYSWYQSNFKK
jgi:hypothetical protein